MLSLCGSVLSAALVAASLEAATDTPARSKLPAPALTTSDEGPAADTAAEPGSGLGSELDPYAEQAPLDVEAITADASKAYLQARARLEAHPKLAAEAILDRLATVPAPGPAIRKRLFDVLAAVARPEDLPLFAEELGRAVKAASDRASALDVYGQWRHHLLDQGASAAPLLRDLVGDKDLPAEVRAGLLADLIEVTPPSGLGSLVVLVGRGRDDLGRTLRRGLSERAREDEVAKTALAEAADEALDRALATPPVSAELKRLPALLRFRAGLGVGNTALTERLVTIANSDDAAFGARAAAVRGLGLLESSNASAGLRTIAQRHLSAPHRSTQAGEVLGWLAIKGLDDAGAADLAAALRLAEDDAPRLAAVGYELGTLNANHTTWLGTAMENPWPQVRQAALGRVEGPCEDSVVGLLGRRAGGSENGGDENRAAARAAVAALGRCGGAPAMRKLGRILDDAQIDMELRAEAARRLAAHGGEDGASTVARQLAATSDRALARRFAAALRKAPKSTAAVDQALCDELRKPGEVARAAAESLRALHDVDDEPCGDAE